MKYRQIRISLFIVFLTLFSFLSIGSYNIYYVTRPIICFWYAKPYNLCIKLLKSRQFNYKVINLVGQIIKNLKLVA